MFIGTGSGITSLNRYHSSFLLTSGDYNLLVDAGDSESRALLNAGIKYNEINSIVFSHFHPDHLNGISSLLIQMKMNKRKNKLEIFVHEELKDLFLKFLEINYIFKLRLGFDLDIKTFKSDEPYIINGVFQFTAKENKHLTKLSDFVKPGDKNLISCSFLFEIEGKRIFYTADVGSKDDLYLFAGTHIDYMISEVSHAELPDLYKTFKELIPAKLFITHISDDIESQLDAWHNGLDNNEKLQIAIAKDTLSEEL